MERECAVFEKVSYIEFERAIKEVFPDTFSDVSIKDMYDNIKLPTRATKGSAGYDFYSPITFSLDNEDSVIHIPLGIRAKIDDGWFLMIVPRSGIGFKYGTRMANTVGIIDSDYYYAENEGHINLKLCDSFRKLKVNAGERVIQGIFVPFGLTYDDTANAERVGGLGSTGVQ